MNNQGNLSPDTIYLNGTVITVNDANPKVEAVATINDKIVSLGDSVTLKQMAGANTKIVDLQGKTLLPAFNDPHVHLLKYPTNIIQGVNILCKPHGSIDSMDGLIVALKERAKVTPKGEWVTGYRYDDLALAEKRHPTRYDLDKASTEHPIHIGHRSGHIGSANSMALEIAGINKNTPDPAGGVYHRDLSSNVPNGVLEYFPALSSLRKHMTIPNLNDFLEMMPQIFKEMHKVGVTSVGEAMVGVFGKQDIKLFQVLKNRNELSVRMNLMMLQSTLFSDDGGNIGFLTGFGDDWLQIGPLKLFGDGSVPGFSGWLTEPYYTPYLGNSEHKGQGAMPTDKLNESVKNAHCSGYQVAIHAGGDAAIDACIEAIRLAQIECPRPDARHRIEHCHVVRDDQLEAFVELGITPSFFIRHTHYWGDRYRSLVLGPERAARIDPLNSAVQKGVRFSIHSDAPHVLVDPLMDIHAAVNRMTADGDEIGPEERITPEQAIRAMTIDAAWQTFEEDIKGSVEIGKLADFVILAENPLKVPHDKIKDIKVEETIVGGKSVYKARTN